MHHETASELRRWATGRAWSRAGAIAAVLATGVPRRVLAATTRVVLLLTGSAAIGVAVGAMLWNDFGPGPLDVFIGAVRTRTGLPLAVAVWVVVGAMGAIAWALGRRPGIGTLVGPLIAGPVMQMSVKLLGTWDPPGTLVGHVLVHAVAIVVLGFGAGALIVSGLGAGTGELLAAAASDRSGRPEIGVRFACEAAWLVLGVVLGGPIGLGTVLVAALIGPSVAHGFRRIDSLVTGSLRQLAVARA
ncbi:MAG TPA: hypothetical protein VK917_04580 [Ilumatobacter sp.]|nr:hypothetical protein [Ilumatobacter sp.]